MSRCASEAFKHGPLPAEALSLAPPVSLIEHGPVRFPDGRLYRYLIGSLPPRYGLRYPRGCAVTRPERTGGLCP